MANNTQRRKYAVIVLGWLLSFWAFLLYLETLVPDIWFWLVAAIVTLIIVPIAAGMYIDSQEHYP